MDVEAIKEDVKSRMGKSVKSLEHDLSKVRTGRANPNILEDIRVDYYGSPTSVLQVANVSVPDAQMILISPWDRGMLSPIEKAILASDLGITPQNDGSFIRLPFPPLDEERRKDLVKSAKKIGEEVKVSIRNIRRDAIAQIKNLQAEKQISQDEEKKELDSIQKQTDSHIDKVNSVISVKEKELMED